MMNTFRKTASSGFSLIEVMIASAIMAVLGFSLMTMISNQQKGIAALTEKLAIKDVELTLKTLLLNDSFCDCLLRGKKMDTVSLSVSPALQFIPNAFTQPPPLAPTPCTNIGSFVIPEVGQSFPNSALKVASLNITDIQAVGPTVYTANLKIGITPSALANHIKAIATPLTLTIDPFEGSINSRPITSCSNRSGKSVKSGSAKIIGCNTNICCFPVIFSVPFSSNNYSISLTYQGGNYGQSSNDMSSSYLGKIAGGFSACFDHNGKTIDNNGRFDWIAVEN